MLSFIFRRLLVAIPTLLIIVTLTFFLIRLAPGGPFHLERPLEAKVMENLNKLYNLDKPLWEQYLLYLKGLLRGDFGPSFIMRDFSVNELFRIGLPNSMLLGSLALLLAVSLGLTFGTVAAFRQNSLVDYIVTGFATFGITVPPLVVAPMLQLLVLLPTFYGGQALGAIGWGTTFQWKNLVLPVIALSLPQIAVVARMTRAAMIEILHSNHIRTMRSMGLPTKMIVKHALRGAVLPVISYLGPAAASLLTGSLVIEVIFTVPGIGRYFVEAALNRDYTLAMGTVVVVAIFVLLFNLIVDILYALVDPRVRLD